MITILILQTRKRGWEEATRLELGVAGKGHSVVVEIKEDMEGTSSQSAYVRVSLVCEQDEAPDPPGLRCLAGQGACLYLPHGLCMAQGPLPSPTSAGALQ